jgi:hypothetical protein
MKKTCLKITSLSGLMLIASGCSSLSNSEDPGSFVFDRLVEECDGNLLIASGDYIREVRDFKIENKENIMPADEASKLNEPNFLQRITRDYQIKGSLYRDISANGAGKWQNMTDRQSAANITIIWEVWKDETRYSLINSPVFRYNVLEELQVRDPTQASIKFLKLWDNLISKNNAAGQECKLFANPKTNTAELFKNNEAFSKYGDILVDTYYRRNDNTFGFSEFKSPPTDFEEFQASLNLRGMSDKAAKIAGVYAKNKAEFDASEAEDLANNPPPEELSSGADPMDAAAAAAAAADQSDYR